MKIKITFKENSEAAKAFTEHMAKKKAIRESFETGKPHDSTIKFAAPLSNIVPQQ